MTLAHIETGHGGRDKTFRRVKETWSYIPKGELTMHALRRSRLTARGLAEMATRFVRLCPTCASEGPKLPRLPVPPVEVPQSPPPASTSTSDEPYRPRFFPVPPFASVHRAQPVPSFLETVLAFPTFPSSLPQPASEQSLSCSPVYPRISASAGIGNNAPQQTHPSSLLHSSAASPSFIDPAAPLHLTAKAQPHEPFGSTAPSRCFGREIQPAATSSSSSVGYNNLYDFDSHGESVLHYYTRSPPHWSSQLDESQAAWTLAGLAAFGDGLHDWTARL